MDRIIEKEISKLEKCKRIIELNNPKKIIINKSDELLKIKEHLDTLISFRIDSEKEKIKYKNNILINLNPLNILNRGYSVIKDKEGNVVDRVSQLSDKTELELNLSDGKVSGVFEILK